ncbi:unnamed protein product [Tuwongella immobilis]|uniref:Uncharacterized protein n=2 Tax=Tuwongella immobilis TaxID=692036 RepID=A0A6C2YUX7_9BACT|nr:unnamed protein product [Tuwongella immobilis]VTS08196.1 unnamed protein product [Tuwongella immobilis]
MKSIEQRVKKQVNALDGCYVDYEVEPLYHGSDKIPYAIRIRATSVDLTSPYCWIEESAWNNPIPNETNPYKCKGAT